MRLDSARSLKTQLLEEVVAPLTTSRHGVAARSLDSVPAHSGSLALGVAPWGKGFRLAVRVQRAALRHGPVVERLTKAAKGEVDIRTVGRIEKRPALAAAPWYQGDARPLLIGASVGHFAITAGTTGAFVSRGGVACILSNNHVLANEDRGQAGDWVLQRAPYDGGRQPAQRVARLAHWAPLKRRGANFVDAALAALEDGVQLDATLLRGLVGGRDRRLAGLGPESVDEGAIVYKVGRTTGPTRGRVTAFALDNVVVGYDLGNLRFDDQIEIEGTGKEAFSDGGDSGSLIVDSKRRAIALLFAGGDSGGRNGAGLTYANPIHRVLDALGAQLLS